MVVDMSVAMLLQTSGCKQQSHVLQAAAAAAVASGCKQESHVLQAAAAVAVASE